MTRKDELLKEIEAVKRKPAIKAEISRNEIKIEWETDINKIDIRNLRSFRNIKTYPALKLEQCSLEKACKTQGRQQLFYDGSGDADKIIELIDLAKKGTKIIPPIFKRMDCYKDDIKECDGDIQFVDGSHRLRIASALGLNEIPILIKCQRKNIFSFDKNTIEITEDGVIINDKNIFNFCDNRIEVRDDGLAIYPPEIPGI